MRADLSVLTRSLGEGAALRRLVGNLDLVQAVGPSIAWEHHSAKRRCRATAEAVRGDVYREIWRDAAEDLDAQVVSLGHGLLQINGPGLRTRTWQQHVMLDDSVSLRVALDKPLVSRLLAEAGLPVAESLEFTKPTLARAVEFLEKDDRPCVVKPARGSGGGAGTVCGISTGPELARAAAWASRATTNLLVERQAEGSVHRFLLLDGQLLDVLKNGPPTVVGDGRHAIHELVATENRRRAAAAGRLGLALLSIDRDCLMTLDKADLSLASVPGDGEIITLKTVTNESGPHDNESLGTDVSPALIAQLAGAAAVIGIRLAGVDVVTTDVQGSLDETGGVIIEINGSPALHRHYHVRKPTPTSRTAVPVLKALRHQTFQSS